MKKTFFTCFLLLSICICLRAQKISPTNQFIAARSGLIIREQASQNAKALGKIAYGAKILLIDPEEDTPAVSIDGFNGKWVKVSYNNLKGYIADCFLLPIPPPATGIKSLEAYLNNISTPVGPDVTIKYEHPGDADAITKRLYKNGAEQHIHNVNEYASTLTFMPYLSLQQVYLLVQLLQEYPEYISPKAFFPRSNQKTKLEHGELIINVKKTGNDPDAAVLAIDMVYTGEGLSNYTLRLYYLDSGQTVVYYDEGL